MRQIKDILELEDGCTAVIPWVQPVNNEEQIAARVVARRGKKYFQTVAFVQKNASDEEKHAAIVEAEADLRREIY